jgi:hypothetical protein
MIDTVYVLDRTILNEDGQVMDCHFMGVLTSRTNVEKRIDAAFHFANIVNGLYRVIEIVLDDTKVAHVYQVKVIDGKQSWLRLAKNKAEGSDDSRFTIEELKLFIPEGLTETAEAIAKLKAQLRWYKLIFVFYTIPLMIAFLIRGLASL